MGVLYSKFWKKPTKEDELKRIVNKMDDLREYKRSTQLKHKRMVANLILYSCLVYIFVCIVVCLWYLPESALVRACLLIPLVLVPFIIYGMKRVVSWFFENRMTKANEQFETLAKEKQKIIDKIMETETFNKAKTILAVYAPDKLAKKDSLAGDSEMRRRVPGDPNSDKNAKKPQEAGSKNEKQTYGQSNQIVPSNGSQWNITGANPRNTQGGLLKAQLPMPQPVFSKNRSIGDKLVEYIVGDGPSYRYALICRHCREHNGMALKEEFPYMSFTCCYCRKFNPPKLMRPVAPRLQESPPPALRYPHPQAAPAALTQQPDEEGASGEDANEEKQKTSEESQQQEEDKTEDTSNDEVEKEKTQEASENSKLEKESKDSDGKEEEPTKGES